MSMRVLLIGGTDSSGGAGLARDLATVARIGAEASIAVTAVTAQTDSRVMASGLMTPELVTCQIQAAGKVDAVKIGMLGSGPIAAAVAQNLPAAPLVLDPVLAASSGRALLDAAGLEVLITQLLPRTTVLTPNLPELDILSDRLGLVGAPDQDSCVTALIARGCKAVLVKGGHAGSRGFCEDRLYLANGTCQHFRSPRYGFSLRGTGCELASAIAVALARGDDMTAAIRMARSVVMTRFETENSHRTAPTPLGK